MCVIEICWGLVSLFKKTNPKETSCTKANHKWCELSHSVIKVHFQPVYFSRDEVSCAESHCAFSQSMKTSGVEQKVSVHTIYSKYCSSDEIVAEVADCFGKSILQVEDAI